MSIQWNNILLSPKQTIRDALSMIDSESSRIALVVDPARKLLGTITDGDIRRGLLKNLSMQDSVDNLMNTSPKIASPLDSKKELALLMEQQGILAIPLVNHDGIVVGLEMLHPHIEQKLLNNPVFLMAGGFGTRLKPLTDQCPKPLLKVGDKPILEITLLNFVNAGFTNFYISTHYMPEKIQNHFTDGSKWNTNIKYVHEKKPLGTGGALGLLPKDIPELPLIMMNADILTNINYQNLLDFHNSSEADVTMCVREYQHQIPYGVITGEGNKIISMVEKPIQKFYINAGIYVVSPEIIKSVKKNTRVDMPTLLEQKITENKKILMFPIHEYWLDIGRIDDFKQAQADIYTFKL